jgi:excisionase family DNA binding protein
MDFPGRVTLRVEEIAEKLRVTPKHVGDLIAEGKLGAVNTAGRDASRACYRIPIEDWRDYILRNMTAPAEGLARFLHALPVPTRRQLVHELQQSLRSA